MGFFESLYGLTRDLRAQNFDLLGARTIGTSQEFDNGASGAAATVQWSIAQQQSMTLTANCTLAFGSAPAGVCIVRLRLVQDGAGGRTVTWPAAVKWQGGGAPALSTAPGSEDVVALYWDGSAYYASPSFGYAAVPTPATHAPTASSIVWQGDSITVGVASNPVTSYPYLASLNFFPGYGSYANAGVAGATIDDCVTALPTAVYPVITAAHAAGQIAVVSLFAGTNDIAVAGHSAAQVEASWTTWTSDVSGRLNANDVVLLWTILPRNVNGFDTTRLAANAWLRANSAGLSSSVVFLVDIGADPTLGPASACTNSELSADGTHPTTFGYGLLAGYAATYAMLNQSQAALTNLSASSGTHTGGTAVTLTGSRFTKNYQVILGGVPAATCANDSDTSIAAVTGAVVGGSTGTGLAAVIGPSGSAVFPSGFSYT